MSFTVRAATQQDYAGINALYVEGDRFHTEALPQIFRSTEGPARPQSFVEGILADPQAELFLAEQDGRLIGLVQCVVREVPALPFFVPRRFVHINDLVVSAPFRRQGVGRRLIEWVHAWAREQGITSVELNVWEFNAGAQALYELLGYTTARRTMMIELDAAEDG